MPFNGLIPFLHQQILMENVLLLCVNALQRAYPISTFLSMTVVIFFYIWCQCPSMGYTHFYPALLEAPVYKGLKGAFSPRFFKLLQKCYTFPVFWFFQNFTFNLHIILPHFYGKCQDFLNILSRMVKRINGI